MALATKVYNGYRQRNFVQIPLQKVRKLVFKKYSSIQEVDHNMKIALSPKYLGDIGAGIKENLDKELFCYNETLKGVPLAYDKITVVSSAIIDDQEFISVSIKVNLLVFKPEIGQNLYGVVNKISDHHYGCLIHECINGSVRKPKEKYLNEKQKKVVQAIEVKDKVLFEVTRLDIHHDILSVSGEIASNFYDKMKN